MIQPSCLICCSEELSPQIKSSQFGDDELSKNLKIIFIFKTIFEVPSERLEYYLSSPIGNGDAITKWGINLCWNCTESVDHVKQMYNQMVKATKLFQESKQNIIKTVKDSEWKRESKCFNRESFPVSDQPGNIIVQETRQFVCESKKLNCRFIKIN